MDSSFTEQLEPFLKNIIPMQVLPTGAEPLYRRDTSVKAILFDIYGTLIISASGDIMQSSYDASMFAKALKGAHYKIKVSEPNLMEIHSIAEEKVSIGKEKAVQKGIPFPELDVVKVWKNTLIKAEKKGLIASTPNSDIRLFTFIFELSSNEVWPMPGLKEMLGNLKSKGYPLGIVSNGQFYTPIIMNYFLHEKIKEDEYIDGFEKDISLFSYKILKGKPDPAVYQELVGPLRARGLKPNDVLYVGNDMLKDIYAASQVGFKTCFYAGDMRAYRPRKDHPQASKIKPDYVITELKQLCEIV